MMEHNAHEQQATRQPDRTGLMVRLMLKHLTLTAGEIEALVRALSPDRHEDRPN